MGPKELALLVSLLVLVACSALSLVLENELASLVSLSAAGAALSIAFGLLSAPDVAITQAVINSGLVTAMFLAFLKQTGSKTRRRRGR